MKIHSWVVLLFLSSPITTRSWPTPLSYPRRKTPCQVAFFRAVARTIVVTLLSIRRAHSSFSSSYSHRLCAQKQPLSRHSQSNPIIFLFYHLPPRPSSIRSNASIMTTAFPRITHIPRRTFSLFGLLSVASSRTMLRKTYKSNATVSTPQKKRRREIREKCLDVHRNRAACP